MTKAEIISEVAKQTGMEKVATARVLESFTSCVMAALKKGNNVYLRGFGSFVVKQRAKKVARNISKNTKITIPAHKVAAFKPSKSFAAMVKKSK